MVNGRKGCADVKPGVVSVLIHVFAVFGAVVVCFNVGVAAVILTICVDVVLILVIVAVVGGQLCISDSGIFCSVCCRFSGIGVAFGWVVFVETHMLVVTW